MRYCEKCKVSVRSPGKYCPLCQGKLTGTPEQQIYPKVPTIYSQFEFFFKLLIMGTVSGGIISVMLNIMFPKSGNWSIYVLFGIVCFWICLSMAIKRKNKIPQNIWNQAVILSAFSVLWDILMGWIGWSLDYVIPIVCSVGMIALAVAAKVLKLRLSDFLVCLAADAIFGIAPLVFYLTGMLNTLLPSFICITISVISLVTILVFEGKNIRIELKKRTHI